MRTLQRLMLRMFGRPSGALGRLGGMIMARTNAGCSAWVASLLEVKPDDHVIEIGFGPGEGIRQLSTLAHNGRVAGVDPSSIMIEQASDRNAAEIARGRVDLRQATAESMPFADERFDKALAINSMQVWPDVIAGLKEVRRVLKPGGRVALGFTPYSGQPREGLTETLDAAGFVRARLITKDRDFCALAIKPQS